MRGALLFGLGPPASALVGLLFTGPAAPMPEPTALGGVGAFIALQVLVMRPLRLSTES